MLEHGQQFGLVGVQPREQAIEGGETGATAEDAVEAGAQLAARTRRRIDTIGLQIGVIDGDGSLYQHIQELETVRRHGIKLLICILNDGGYGAESHKFRAYGVNPEHAVHGRGDLARVASGFGLNSAKVTTMGRLEGLFREHQAGTTASLWDVHVDDLIPSRNYRRVHYGEA